ncbi:MAG: ABC transporter permease [Lentisphaeria bacterium]|nr:ABC transporter permease [Lentisphaeria bacterium]MBO5802983.1 ABC transporter permease [Lentisphaeria bacterium]MBO5958689.1 ABC transporter permease [Lentisphaeria bacterium]MBR4885088.1 ABC transporter permease [Lentisphaeria bacterium]
MKFSDQISLSFHNLMLHKIRSVLTSLGIIFGVGSVISMLSISQGAKEQALASIEAMGIDKIIVSSRKPPMEGKDTSNASATTQTYGLTLADLQHIRQMENVKRVTVARNTRQKIMKGITLLELTLIGVDPAFLKDSNSNLIQGRWLAPGDYLMKAPNCVVGRNVKRKLFNLGEQNIIGSRITVENHVYNVVGVIENNHGTNILGIGKPDDMIIIPMTTSQAKYGNRSSTVSTGTLQVEEVEYDTFIVTVEDTFYIDYTSKRIAAYLDKTHGARRDWEKLVPYDLLLQKEKTQNIFTIVMASIAGISLLVGGIGIMNIMLANVYERRKEIGTRRALGAKKNDIIIQFLLETIFLTFLGGTIGVGMGIGIAEVVARYAGMPVAFSVWFILLALVISAAIGILFGTYPAWKAAQQNPIDVLRAE